MLSRAAYNRRVGLALWCLITNQVKGYPFEVPLPPGHGIGGVILADQVKNLDWRARNADTIARLPASVLADVFGKFLTLLQSS